MNSSNLTIKNLSKRVGMLEAALAAAEYGRLYIWSHTGLNRPEINIWQPVKL